jgi:hypothetical protein
MAASGAKVSFRAQLSVKWVVGLSSRFDGPNLWSRAFGALRLLRACPELVEGQALPPALRIAIVDRRN